MSVNLLKCFVLTAAVFALQVVICCDENQPGCSDACRHLLNCENEWLAEDGQPEMNATQETEFLHECNADCDGEQNDIDCLYYTSCNDLAEGDCL